MAGNGNQVRSQGFGLEGNFQEALDGIRVKNGIGAEPVGELCHLSNGHDGTRLVVDHHNGYKNGVLPKGGFQGIQRDIAQVVRLQIGHLEALGLQVLHAIQNGMVLYGGGDDVLSPLAQAFGGAVDGPVVGLGAAGGEENPVRFRAHGGGDGMAGAAQLPGGVDAEVIQCRGIAPVLGQRLGDSLHSLGTGLGGGGIIEIDHVFPYFPTQKRSKIRLVMSSRTVAPVTSPMASIAASTSSSSASGVTASFSPCRAESRLS